MSTVPPRSNRSCVRWATRRGGCRSSFPSPRAPATGPGARAAAARRLPIVFPVHPRTRDRLRSSGLAPVLAQFPALRTTAPLGYLDMLALLEGAETVLTDSG